MREQEELLLWGQHLLTEAQLTSFTSLWSFWLASSERASSLLADISCSSISPT